MANSNLTMSEEQKQRLGDKYITEGTGVTDNDTNTKYRICKIEDDGILLKEASSFSNHPKPEIKVPFDEFMKKYDNKEISVSGYTHEVPDQIILHQVIMDIVSCADINKLRNEVGELTTEDSELKSGGIILKAKSNKKGKVTEIRNQFGKKILSVKVGDDIYTYNPKSKDYESIQGSETHLLGKKQFEENKYKIQTLKSGGGIKNQYEGKFPEKVWNDEWTIDQRIHFLRDHWNKFGDETKVAWDFVSLAPNNWSVLPKDVKEEIRRHMEEGQYKNAGKIIKEEDLQEKAEKMVEREVYANQGSLVEKLLQDEIIPIDDIQNYYRPAEEGEDEDQPQEILEWWLISDWLKDKLMEQGEPIIDNEYGTWWGRTTSGQVIYMDGVIRKIVKEINERKTGGKAGSKTEDEKGYQGWKNYETWNVKLWLDNDSGSQSFWDERATEIAKTSKKSEYLTKKQEATRTLADELKEYHEDNNPLSDKPSTYSDLLGFALGNVDWREIAENLLSEKMKYGGEMKTGGEIKYKVVDGTSYHEETPDEVVSVLENARKNNTRIKIYYGDVKTGRDWHEEYDTTGTVGRSTGEVKIPLLISTSRSMGGGSILDNAIVKIKDIKTEQVLYQHPKYVIPNITIVPSDLPEYQYNTLIDGELHGRHKTLRSAEMTKKKLMGRGGNTNDDAGREFRYLKLTPKENGLEIRLTQEGLEKVKDEGLTYDNAWEYFDDIQGNSEYIYHPNLGESGFGLTDAEGITDGYYPSENVVGEYDTDHPDSAKLYYFNRSAIVFWGDELLEDGVVTFNEHKERKQGGKADVTANYYRFRQHSPKYVTECAVPQWGQKVAEATKKGAKITTCKKDGKWFLQSILIPKKGVSKSDATRMANEIKSKFVSKKKALGGVAETCTCDDIETTIEGLETLRDTTQDEDKKKRYQTLIDILN